jgi:hypothetical protein
LLVWLERWLGWIEWFARLQWIERLGRIEQLVALSAARVH